jgi:hypothetical protein
MGVLKNSPVKFGGILILRAGYIDLAEELVEFESLFKGLGEEPIMVEEEIVMVGGGDDQMDVVLSNNKQDEMMKINQRCFFSHFNFFLL